MRFLDEPSLWSELGFCSIAHGPRDWMIPRGAMLGVADDATALAIMRRLPQDHLRKLAFELTGDPAVVKRAFAMAPKGLASLRLSEKKVTDAVLKEAGRKIDLAAVNHILDPCGQVPADRPVK